MFYRMADLVPPVAALCLLFLLLGFLLGRGPGKAKEKRRWYKVPGALCLTYDQQNPLNRPEKRTDGWN